MNFEPGSLLIDLGTLAIFSSVIGGGLALFGINIGLVKSIQRQALLVVLGVALIFAGTRALPDELKVNITVSFSRNGVASDNGVPQWRQIILTPALQERGWTIADTDVRWSSPTESPKPKRGLKATCSLPSSQVSEVEIKVTSYIINQQEVFYKCDFGGLVDLKREKNIRTIAASALPLTSQDTFNIVGF